MEWFGVSRKKIDKMAENLNTLFILQERSDIEDKYKNKNFRILTKPIEKEGLESILNEFNPGY